MTTFVFSIDDAGSGGEDMVDSFRRSCRFFESRDVRPTWFFVPLAGGRPMSDAWLEAALAGRDAGHDLQLHGRTHSDCFEFGPPNYPATKINGRFETEFEARRDELTARYATANLRAWIEEGIEIFETRLGVRPTAFRAPCGAISKPMFEALSQVGIGCHSCVYVSASGYEHLPHLSGVLEQDWSEVVPHRPFRWYHGVIEAPILNEYTWRGAAAREPEFVALAQRDLDRIAGESPIAVILMHTHGIADDYDYAFRMIDAIIERVTTCGYGRFATFGELLEAGEMERAATVEGPDILTV